MMALINDCAAVGTLFQAVDESLPQLPPRDGMSSAPLWRQLVRNQRFVAETLTHRHILGRGHSVVAYNQNAVQ
jgi:hypothetical protein